MRRILLSLPLLSILLWWACDQQPTREFELDLSKFADSLRGYDSIRILLRSPDSSVVDTVFHGKLEPGNDLSALSVRDIRGEKVIITVLGFQDGKAAYQVDRYYNGSSGKTDSALAWILPKSAVSLDIRDTEITVGDSAPLPAVSVTPAELRDKSVVWNSADTLYVAIFHGRYHALGVGRTRLTVRLAADTAKTAFLEVRVIEKPPPIAPKSLRISPDTLRLTLNGGTKRFSVDIQPDEAAGEVSWSTDKDSLVALDSLGQVKGLAVGKAAIYCFSKSSPEIGDTAWVRVTEGALPDSVRIAADSIQLFLGGTGRTLSAKVFPPAAEQSIDWSVVEPGIITLAGNVVEAKAVGLAHVVAKSEVNPLRTDTVVILVKKALAIESLSLEADSMILFQGGSAKVLAYQVIPQEGKPAVAWISRDTAVALVAENGVVAPVRSGRTWVVAMSQIDSSRKDSAAIIVKRDAPRLSVGRDTTLRLGAELIVNAVVQQEYGGILSFRWDIDGKSGWDDSAAEVVPVRKEFPDTGSFALLFSVRDGEGNETSATRKIRIVRGPIVFIESPLDSQYTNANPVEVKWSINGISQAAQNRQYLVEGPNVLLRSGTDSTGVVNSAAITVFLDTLPPKPPIIQATSPTSSRNPLWTWRGGGDGKGVFRFSLDTAGLAKSPESEAVSFAPIVPLDSGAHILYVEERDQAGNWSSAASKGVRIDLTPPPAPIVILSASSKPNNPLPGWTWSSVKGDGIGIYRYRLDDSNAVAGTETPLRAFASPTDLSDGRHTLYVTERDSAGNWSSVGRASITLDLQPPRSPRLTIQASLSDSTTIKGPTALTRPVWVWASAETGGTGKFRFRLDTAEFPAGFPVTTSKLFVPGVDLREGLHTLYVQETDSADNWSPSSQASVTIDLTPPAKPIVSAISPTNNRKPLWNWAGAGGGSGLFRYCVDCLDLGMTYSLTEAVSFAPASLLPEGNHTLSVQERDSAGNWSGTGSFTIRVDLTPPQNPKIIEKPATPTFLPGPSWTWITQGGGAGFFRYRFDNRDLPGGDSGHVTQTNLPAAAPPGIHTLFVQERDSAGNWSGIDSANAVLVADSIIGGAPLSQVAVTAVDMKVSGAYLYVAYIEGGKIFVKRTVQSTGGAWNQGWEQLGGAVGAGVVTRVSLGLRGSIPFLAFQESPAASKNPLKLYKLSGADWIAADTAGIVMGDTYGDFRLLSYQNPNQSGGTSDLFLAMVFEETGDPEIQVFRYDFTKWTRVRKGPGIWSRKIAATATAASSVQFDYFTLDMSGPGYHKLGIGKAGDSTTSLSFNVQFPLSSSITDMVKDATGITYMSFAAPNPLWKYDGATLQTIPIPTNLTSGNIPLALYGNNTLFTAYPIANKLEAAALWPDGWHTLGAGSGTFATGGVYCLTANFLGMPLVAFSDAANGGRLAVRAFGY